ncbi:hypothetical protein [Streptacidiphilus sp. P02-A3a]|uniref:hypothetical protein n=1 Tax=Streptacidiphilus sp. P02-A3a TaxID=2704468 RepID=UPI0015FBA682|nr:hypothetical protein [Streptacidiphilus sp. P02-A3a]QMU72054.1 hypothetical protein GXP74_31265 [Streptacidiphilus sp. P02-A3a]
MRSNLRTSVVAAVATLCVAMSAGIAVADDCAPWDHDQPVVTQGGAAFGAGTANGDVVAYRGPSGEALIGHHSEAGVGAIHW